jgi:menaquinone-dependent protoporphyrinogen IX oxidase
MEPHNAVVVFASTHGQTHDFFTRTLMRLMMRREHHPTDASQDYDYTDWDAVERFARQCSALLTVAPAR